MMFSQWLDTHRIFKRLAKALISLRVCAGWSEPLLVAHTTLLEISCHGSNRVRTSFKTGARSNSFESIRIYLECESVPRIGIWHHEACWVMTNGDRKGWNFVSHPHTNNGFIFFITITYCIFTFKKKAPKSSWIRWDVTYLDDVTLS